MDWITSAENILHIQERQRLPPKHSYPEAAPPTTTLPATMATPATSISKATTEAASASPLPWQKPHGWFGRLVCFIKARADNRPRHDCVLGSSSGSFNKAPLSCLSFVTIGCSMGIIRGLISTGWIRKGCTSLVGRIMHSHWFFGIQIIRGTKSTAANINPIPELPLPRGPLLCMNGCLAGGDIRIVR